MESIAERRAGRTGLEELVSIKTLSLRWGVKERTLREWVAKREMPFHKIGRLVRFNVREIRAWADRGRVGPLTAEIIKARMP